MTTAVASINGRASRTPIDGDDIDLALGSTGDARRPSLNRVEDRSACGDLAGDLLGDASCSRTERPRGGTEESSIGSAPPVLERDRDTSISIACARPSSVEGPAGRCSCRGVALRASGRKDLARQRIEQERRRRGLEPPPRPRPRGGQEQRERASEAAHASEVAVGGRAGSRPAAPIPGTPAPRAGCRRPGPISGRSSISRASSNASRAEDRTRSAKFARRSRVEEARQA
jgi:hypothetical protein